MKIAKRIARFANRIALSLVWVAAGGVLVAVQEGFAQTVQGSQAAPTQPAFDVASVKPLPDLSNLVFRVDHGTLTARMGLRWLIAWAYNLPVAQVIAPDWVTLRCVEILGKAGTPVGEDQVRLMVRTLLADRFKLQVHHETRETNILALTVGKNGHRLKESKSEGRWRRRLDEVERREIFTGVTMTEFVSFVAQYYGGTLDHTGLTGRYDFVLDYQTLIEPEPKSLAVAVIESRREALRQVGLRLDPVREPLDFVVVDHVENDPTEN